MAVYTISYDLRAPGRDYKSLYAALSAVPHCHALESMWYIETPQTAAQVRDALKEHMDSNDGLSVIEITESAGWAVFGLLNQCANWMKARRP